MFQQQLLILDNRKEYRQLFQVPETSIALSIYKAKQTQNAGITMLKRYISEEQVRISPEHALIKYKLGFMQGNLR